MVIFGCYLIVFSVILMLMEIKKKIETLKIFEEKYLGPLHGVMSPIEMFAKIPFTLNCGML